MNYTMKLLLPPGKMMLETLLFEVGAVISIVGNMQIKF